MSRTVVSRTRVVCRRCGVVGLNSNGYAVQCRCGGTELRGIVDGRCRGRDMTDAFSEIERMDLRVSEVEMETRDLLQVFRSFPNAAEQENGVWMLWGARVRLDDWALMAWSEKQGGRT